MSAAAAYTAANNLSSYVQVPAMVLGAAVSSFAAQNIGAGHWERVRRTTWIGIAYNFVLTGGAEVIIYMFNRGDGFESHWPMRLLISMVWMPLWWSFPVGFVISVVTVVLLLLFLEMEVDEYGRWPQKYDASKG